MRQRRGAPTGATSSGMFFAPGATGLKVGPTTVLVLSFVFMGAVVTLHILSKIKSVVSPAQSEE